MVTRFNIPAWYINRFTIIDFTIYTRFFLVKLKIVVDGPILHSKSVVDGPILHSKSVVDGSILHSKAKVCIFSVFMMVKLLIYHTGMCIKGPESWWIAKSITSQLLTREIVTDFAIHQLSGPLITPFRFGGKGN